MSIRFSSLCALSLLVLLVSATQATATTIAFSGRAFSVSPGSGLDASVTPGTRFQGQITVDLGAPLPDPPDDPQFPTQGLHNIQIDDFQFSIGNYFLQGGGVSNLTVFDESQIFGGDVIRFGIANLQSTPSFAPGGTLFMVLDFTDDTRNFVPSTDLLFPTDLSDWTSAGLTFTEFAPGVGFVPKFLARFDTWSMVPEPSTLGLGILALGALAGRSRALRR